MPASSSERVLVLLHGRWYKPDSMQELADRLELPGVRCIAPAAPERTWYPKRFFDPREVNEPQLSQALATVHETLDRLAAEGVDPERIVVGGFSQGGCVTCDALARRPRRVGALAALCGGLIGPDDELARPDPGSLEGLPVLLTAIEEDEWVPVERIQRTADVFSAAGARVELCVYPPGEHEVHDEEVAAFRRLLLELS
jgi:phospholipase/carboxylesterase